MKIFTIIVTYNGMKWLKRCLDSLRSSTMPTIPVVIDNNSTDGSVSFVKENYPEAIVFQQDKNLGFGQANNIGIRYALENAADFVMLLNQDAYLEKDALELMTKECDENSLISPIQMNGDGSAFDFGFKNDTLLKSDSSYLDDLACNNLKARYKIGETCAACWLLPKKIIEKIGGFNPLFFHYGEDNNYYNRLFFHGIETYIVPKAFVYHDRECNCSYGNEKAFFNKRVFRQMLVIATDINLCFSMRIKEYLQVLKNCYRLKTPGHRYKIGMFSTALFKIVLMSGKIRHSRKNEKIEQKNWI